MSARFRSVSFFPDRGLAGVSRHRVFVPPHPAGSTQAAAQRGAVIPSV